MPSVKTNFTNSEIESEASRIIESFGRDSCVRLVFLNGKSFSAYSERGRRADIESIRNNTPELIVGSYTEEVDYRDLVADMKYTLQLLAG